MLASATSCLICEAPLAPLEARASAVCARVACRWAHRALPTHEACVVCGRPLSAHDRAARTCGDRGCRVALLQARQREREQARRARVEAHACALRDRSAADAGVASPAAYPVTVLPSLTAPATHLPKQRRRALREHLAPLVAQAFADEGPGASESDAALALEATLGPSAPAHAPDLDAAMGSACAQCRGYCCAGGGEHAYLTADTMRRYRALHPAAAPDDVLAAYLGHVGATTHRRSCVYHGATGCTLPRAMRSDTCNRFLCEPLRAFERRVRDGDAARAFFAPADGDGARGGAFVDARDVRVVRRAPA